MAKKKNFTTATQRAFIPDKGALQYITPAAEEAPEKSTPAKEKAPARAPEAKRKGYASKAERRSKRVQILITESMYAKLNKQAEKENRSVNDLINAILETGLE